MKSTPKNDPHLFILESLKKDIDGTKDDLKEHKKDLREHKSDTNHQLRNIRMSVDNIAGDHSHLLKTINEHHVDAVEAYAIAKTNDKFYWKIIFWIVALGGSIFLWLLFHTLNLKQLL